MKTLWYWYCLSYIRTMMFGHYTDAYATRIFANWKNMDREHFLQIVESRLSGL